MEINKVSECLEINYTEEKIALIFISRKGIDCIVEASFIASTE